ncbi:MAG: alpha/beta fold hydrolase [Actinomyces sp.]|nr:MAG: alpha/beta fold hydrolase [Actinomyces sp.]
MRAPARPVEPGTGLELEPAAPWIGRPALPPLEHVEVVGRGRVGVRRVAGPPGAPTVVLLHGWTVTAAVNWHTVFVPLADHLTVLAPDLRGHGDGIRDRRRFRLEDAADDVAALADTLGLDRVVVAGYSLGGAVAQLVWRRHPSRVAGLVLAATFARQALTRPERVALRTLAGVGRASRLVGRRRQLRMLDALARRWSTGPDRPPWYMAEVRRGSVPHLLEAAGAIAAFDATGWIGEVGVPTGILITDRDEVVAPDRQHRLAALVPHARLAHLDADHDACVTDPRFVPAFVDLIRHAAGLDTGDPS